MGMVSSKTELPEYKKINVMKIERHLKACLDNEIYECSRVRRKIEILSKIQTNYCILCHL